MNFDVFSFSLFFVVSGLIIVHIRGRQCLTNLLQWILYKKIRTYVLHSKKICQRIKGKELFFTMNDSKNQSQRIILEMKRKIHACRVPKLRVETFLVPDKKILLICQYYIFSKMRLRHQVFLLWIVWLFINTNYAKSCKGCRFTGWNPWL